MMLFAVVIFVLVNLLAGEFNRFRDLTAEELFTLSQQSRDFIADLDRDVLITSIAQTGQENVIISQLLGEYAAASSHIRVEQRDPMLNPALIHQMAERANIEGGIPPHSVIVESGGVIRVVFLQDMIQTELVNMWGQTRIVSLNFEREITRAIQFVTQGEPSIIYYVTGSGEAPMDVILASFLETENFIMQEIDLVLNDIPEDADILFIPTPARDWGGTKAERIADFLENEGRAFFAIGLTSVDTPNLDAVLAAYGIAIGENILFEGDTRNVFGHPLVLIPNVESHEITTDAMGRSFAHVIPFASSVELLDTRMVQTQIEPLWTTSRSAFGRVDVEEESVSQVPGDIPGPFDLAVAITHRQMHGQVTFTTQMVVVSNNTFLDAAVIRDVGLGNWQFILNSLRWMQDQPPGIWVPGRVPPGQAPIMITEHQVNLFSGISMGGIPILCIGIGIFIWFRRRHS